MVQNSYYEERPSLSNISTCWHTLFVHSYTVKTERVMTQHITCCPVDMYQRWWTGMLYVILWSLFVEGSSTSITNWNKKSEISRLEFSNTILHGKHILGDGIISLAAMHGGIMKHPLNPKEILTKPSPKGFKAYWWRFFQYLFQVEKTSKMMDFFWMCR